MKRLGSIALVVFLIYFIVRSPVEAADTVKHIATAIGHAANSVATALTTFLQTLF